MSRSQTSVIKKEKEKKRLQKRKEKEERKKERQANAAGKKSLEDMMAYVDENGNITSTPPDPLKKKTIAAENIVIATPKDFNSPAKAGIHTGKVTYYNASKAYGFIKDDQTLDSVFFHNNALRTPVKENDRVSFQVERGPKGMAAADVKKV